MGKRKIRIVVAVAGCVLCVASLVHAKRVRSFTSTTDANGNQHLPRPTSMQAELLNARQQPGRIHEPTLQNASCWDIC